MLVLASTLMVLMSGDPLRDSLPVYTGETTISGLTAPVTIRRDVQAVPIIEGAAALDVMTAQGFVHSQERFFQMDLARRYAAGELAEVVGPPMLATDRTMRHHRFRSVAAAVVAALTPEDRAILDAYVRGVNAYLAQAAAPPPEYALLNAKPAPWTAEDSILVILSMYDALHREASVEARMGVMQEAMPAELVAFLTPDTTRDDSPLILEPDGTNGHRPALIPAPEIIDLRTRTTADAAAAWLMDDLIEPRPLLAGSNNWAVAGTRTTDGRAIVANDPHLMLAAPVLWYRCELAWPGHRAVGVSLPGVPWIVIGSTDHLAWGVTNATADFQDWIIVEVDPDDPSRYRTPQGWEPFGEIVETIRVRGGADEPLTLRATRWGVVQAMDHRGRPMVLRWTAHDPAMTNLGLMRMINARTLEEGLAVARAWRGPSQNVVMADATGRIGWVISGGYPNRAGFSGKFPESWADGSKGWNGELPEHLRPQVIDPPSGVVFTANNRTSSLAQSRRLSSMWAGPDRAKRIAMMLSSARKPFSESDLLDMQLDTRVTPLEAYQALALRLLDGVEDAELAQARQAIAAWSGEAEVDQPGLPLLNAWQRRVRTRVLTPIMRECTAIDPSFRYGWYLADEVVARLLEERPDHLLAPGFETWDSLLLTCLREAIADLKRAQPPLPIDATWGQVNRAAIRHPVAEAAPPFLRGMLGMPEDPLPGHPDAVRVAAPTFGASMRLVVSPGRAADGFLQLPTGQSGHPLSPHFRDQHRAWLEGRPTPLRPGEIVHTFTLAPPAE